MQILDIRIVSKRALSDALPGVKRVYVGRPSPLGNPFPLKREAERDQVVLQYRRWLSDRFLDESGAQRMELERLYAIAQEQPLELVCWCAPKRCHADVIAEALHAMHRTRNRA